MPLSICFRTVINTAKCSKLMCTRNKIAREKSSSLKFLKPERKMECVDCKENLLHAVLMAELLVWLYAGFLSVTGCGEITFRSVNILMTN